MGVCVGGCGSLDLFCAPVPHTSAFSFILFALLAAAAAVSCRLYHTVPQALQLSTLWRPRYNSSLTESLRRPRASMRALALHMRVSEVCVTIIHEHVSCATTAVLLKGNSTW